jgi:hypothetical protein
MTTIFTHHSVGYKKLRLTYERRFQRFITVKAFFPNSAENIAQGEPTHLEQTKQIGLQYPY